MGATLFTSSRRTRDSAEALGFVSQLTWPATRHVAFRGNDRCTVLVNNSRNGSDYADYVVLIPKHLRCRFARVLAAPRKVWVSGSHREVLQFQATIFELRDETGACLRSIACLDDGGRWRFDNVGEPHPIEASFPYDRRRKRERFAPGHLHQLLQAHDLPVITAGDFLNAGEYLLATSAGADRLPTCTLAEADDPAFGYYQRGLTWCNHLETHASSAIADFEKCVRLNPAYASKVGGHLERAYRQIGKSEGR